MSLISGVHHVSMKCCDEQEYEKTIQFYAEVLGLPIIRQWPKGTMLGAGTSLIEIFNDGEEKLEQGVIRHFAFATSDVDQCVAAVKAAGYEVFTGPKEIVIQSEPAYPARIAFCYGPLGEEIEFFQER